MRLAGSRGPWGSNQMENWGELRFFGLIHLVYPGEHFGLARLCFDKFARVWWLIFGENDQNSILQFSILQECIDNIFLPNAVIHTNLPNCPCGDLSAQSRLISRRRRRPVPHRGRHLRTDRRRGITRSLFYKGHLYKGLCWNFAKNKGHGHVCVGKIRDSLKEWLWGCQRKVSSRLWMLLFFLFHSFTFSPHACLCDTTSHDMKMGWKNKGHLRDRSCINQVACRLAQWHGGGSGRGHCAHVLGGCACLEYTAAGTDTSPGSPPNCPEYQYGSLTEVSD